MAKRNLSALLDTSITEAPAEGGDSPAPESAAQASSLAPPPAVPTVADTPPTKQPGAPVKSARPAQSRARVAIGPRYLELDRKELRIRGDQADDLTALTRQLNRARKGEGERITDNTLIRVAIDLLMRDRGKLQGATEAELLRSVLPD